MKAFPTHQRVFTMMCILPMADNTETWKKILIVLFGATVPLSVISGFLASVVYVSKYATVDLEESVKTVYQIAAYMNVSYTVTLALLRRNQILEVIKKFQSIYDASKTLLVSFKVEYSAIFHFYSNFSFFLQIQVATLIQSHI